jgi:hypothetical protein
MAQYTQPDEWRSAWRRVLRGRKRLDGHFPDSEEYDDALYHFFQDAWHLKDWLKNDPSIGRTLTGLEDELRKHQSLMIAADMANGTKHRLLTTIRAGANITEKHHIIQVGNPKPVLQVRLLKLNDGSQHKDSDVADQAIAAWRAVFTTLGLAPNA